MQGNQEIEFSFFHERFNKTRTLYPGRCAITGISYIDDFKALRYDVLDNYATSMAASLLKHGVQSMGKTIVATYLGRTIDTVMANIAIHKMGAGFLNLSELNNNLDGFEHMINCLQQPEPLEGKVPFVIECVVTTSQLWLPIHLKLLEGKPRLNIIKKLILLDTHEVGHSNKTINFADAKYAVEKKYIRSDIFPDQTIPPTLTSEDIAKLGSIKIDSDHIAYIKYSSGTTGKPKAIIIRHSGIMSRIDSEVALFNSAAPPIHYTPETTENEHVIQLIDHSVDASFNEMILALAYGGCLHVVDRETVENIDKLWQFFEEKKISTTILVPSVWHRLAVHGGDDSPTRLKHLKRILTTGEAANIPLISNWLKVDESIPRVVINAYGPTEGTFGFTLGLVTKENMQSVISEKDGKKYLSVGKPMAGTTLFIVERDPGNKDCPTHFTVLAEIPYNSEPKNYAPGVTGEIIAIDMNPIISGLAIGYGNNTAKDKLAFIEIDKQLDESTKIKTSPDRKEETIRLSKTSGSTTYRAYRTGDKACLTENMQLTVLGRYDRQVKINGRQPIDLENIENLLCEAICDRKNIVDEEKKKIVACKVFYRHQEYIESENKDNKYDDKHFVTFIKLSDSISALNESDLIYIYHYMYQKLGSNIGIPTLWYTAKFADHTHSSEAWKVNDKKYFLDRLWSTNLETTTEDGFKVISRCSQSFKSSDAVECQIISLWKELLFPHIDVQLGPDSHFEMLGGTSLLSSEMIAMLEAKNGEISINPSNFYKTGTIRGLLKDVQTAIATKDKIKVKKTGDGHALPVYMVPPPMGAVQDTYDFFRQEIDNRIVVSWDSPSVANDKLMNADLGVSANHHIATIMKEIRHKKHQPYVIVGYSSGGVQAFEVARQLSSQGKASSRYQVILIMIDSPCPVLSQQMTFDSYKKFVIEEFLKHTLTSRHFKFKQAEFAPSVGLDSKRTLLEEVKKFLLDHSDHVEDSEKEKQNIKITVSINHLIAELDYKIPENSLLDFPVLLLTSNQFRQNFSKVYEYEKISKEDRELVAKRLGWPEKWLTQHPISLEGTHFELMQKPRVVQVAREATKFFSSAERLIQRKLLQARISSMPVNQSPRQLSKAKTSQRVLSLTTDRDVCQRAFERSQLEHRYNGDDVVVIYMDYAMARACLHKDHSILDLYFRKLEIQRETLDKKIDKSWVKNNHAIVVYLDHIYDVKVLKKVYRAFKDEGSDPNGYQVLEVNYTLEPQIFDLLSSKIQQELKKISFPSYSPKPNQVVAGNILKTINDYAENRYKMLLAQDFDYYDSRRELILELAINYTLNLVNFLYMKSSNMLSPIEEIDFSLVSTPDVKSEMNFIYTKLPLVLLENKKFLFAIRFCCPFFQQLKADIQSVQKDPLYMAIIKDAHINRVDVPHDFLPKDAKELMTEYFRVGPETHYLLKIKKFESRLAEILTTMKDARLTPLSEVWCLKIILESISFMMNKSTHSNKVMLNYLLKMLLCISNGQENEIHRFAQSLIISLLKLQDDHGELFEMCYLDKSIQLKSIRSKLQLSCQAISSRIDLSYIEPVKVMSSGKNITHRLIHNTDFSHSVFRNIYFKDCQFIDVNFDDAQFIDCSFESCTFKHCSMANTRFNSGNIEMQSDICTRMMNVKFVECYLEGACLDHTNLIDCEYHNCDITDFTLRNAKVDGVKINSITRNKISSEQFAGTAGERITISIEIISPGAVAYFASQPLLFMIQESGQNLINGNENDNERYKIIKQILEKNKPSMMGLEKIYGDILTKPMFKNDLKSLTLHIHAREYCERKQEKQPETTVNDTEEKVGFRNTKFFSFRAFDGKTKSQSGKSSKVTTVKQVEMVEVVQDTQVRKLEVQRKKDIHHRNEDHSEMRLVKGVKFIQSSTKQAPLSENLTESEQNTKRSALRLPEHSLSSNGVCWLYRPVISGQNIIIDENSQQIVYANILDALSVAACNACRNLPCQCIDEVLMRRDIQIVRVNAKDLILLTSNGIQQLCRESLFEIKSDTQYDEIGTLQITPNSNHPFFYPRSSLTLIPTPGQYISANKGAVCVHFNDLMKLLAHYTKAIDPFFITTRVTLVKKMIELLDADPMLAVEKILDREILTTESEFLTVFINGIRESKLHSKVILMAASRHANDPNVKISPNSYGQKLIQITEEDKKTLAEIDSLREGSDPIRLLTSQESLERSELHYALSYYLVGDHEARARILSSYISSDNIPYTRLLKNRAGYRIREFDSLTDISLLKILEENQNSEQNTSQLSFKGIRESFSEKSQSGEDSVEKHHASEEIPPAEKMYEDDDLRSVDSGLNKNRRPKLITKFRNAFSQKLSFVYVSEEKVLEIKLKSNISALYKNSDSIYQSFIVGKDQSVAIIKVENPLRHFAIYSLLKRIHGLVPNCHYGVIKSGNYPAVICEDLQPVSSDYDEIRKMGDYSLTLKLFELCILGRHKEWVLKSHAAIKAYPVTSTHSRYYPSYCEINHTKEHQKVMWEPFFEKLVGNISELAIAELEFLDPDMVINYWIGDIESFERQLPKIFSDKNISTWKKDLPDFVIKIKESFSNFHDWLMENKSRSLSYAEIWKERGVIRPVNSTTKNKPSTVASKDIWSHIRQGIWNDRDLYRQLEDAMASGDEKLLSDLMKRITPKMMLKFLREFELVNSRLEHVEKLLNKIMETNYTHIALNNPSQALLDTLSKSENRSKVQSIELVNCTEDTTFDAKEFPALKKFEVSGTAGVALSNFKQGTIVELGEATHVRKFTGDTAVLVQIASHIDEKSTVGVNDLNECVKQAKHFNAQNAFRIAKTLAKAAIESKKDDQELKHIFEINDLKEHVSDYVLEAIRSNDCTRLNSVLNSSGMLLEHCVSLESLTPALISSLEKGQDDLVAHVLSLNIQPSIELLTAAIKATCNKTCANIINSGKLNLNTVNSQGVSPLSQAILTENEHVITLLLDNGVSIGAHLAQAVQLDVNENIISRLLDKATIEDVNYPTHDDSTLLQTMAARKHYHFVECLLNKGASVRSACKDVESGLISLLAKEYESLKDSNPSKQQLEKLLSRVKEIEATFDDAESDDESVETEKSYYLKSVMSADRNTLVIVHTKSITFIDVSTGSKIELSGAFYDSDIVTLDSTGKHLMILRGKYFVLIRVEGISTGPIIKTATLGDDLGLLGACLSQDGQYVIYCLNESSDMPYRIYKTDHLLEDGVVELSEIAHFEVSADHNTENIHQMIISSDHQYFAVANQKGICIGEIVNERLSLIDGNIQFKQGQQPIIKLMFNKVHDHYQLGCLSHSDFELYDVMPDQADESTLKCVQHLYVSVDEISDEKANTGQFSFEGERFVDCTIDHTGKLITFIDQNRHLYQIVVDSGEIRHNPIENCNAIYLSSDGNTVLMSEREKSVDIRFVQVTGEGNVLSDINSKTRSYPIFCKEKKSAETRDSNDTKAQSFSKHNPHSSSPGKTPQSLFNQQRNASSSANSAAKDSNASIASQANRGESNNNSFKKKVNVPLKEPKLYGLFDHEKKDSTEKKALFASVMPENHLLGRAVGEGDCFYDSCAQALNAIFETQEYTVKSLRLLCHEYAVELDKKCNTNPLHQDNWIGRILKAADYQQYLANVAYTVEEREEGYGIGGDKMAVWGEQHIDGRILCEKLGIKLHVIEERQNPEDLTNKDQKYLVSHNLVDGNGLKNVEEDKIDWNDKNVIHLAISNLHFVPVLKIIDTKKSFNGQSSQSTSTQFTTPDTIGDGNCAYNATALGLCQLIIEDRLPASEAADRIMQVLNQGLENEALIEVKQIISQWSDIQKQKRLAPILRELAVNYLEKNYQTLYRDAFIEKLVEEYANYRSSGARGDMYCVHPEIFRKFNENLSINDLEIWWENEGRENYFRNIRQSASYPLDMAKWGSEIEMAALAILFHINIKVDNSNLLLGVNGGNIEGKLTPEQITNLNCLDIGERYNGLYRLHMQTKEELKHKLEPLNRGLCEKVYSVIESLTLRNSRECTGLFDHEEEQVLFERGILTRSANQIIFIGNHNDNTKDINRITNKLNGEPNLFDLLSSHLLTNVPEFIVRNTGGHWTFIRVSPPLAILKMESAGDSAEKSLSL